MINYCDSISLYKQINKPTSIVCRWISVAVRTIWSGCCRQKSFQNLAGMDSIDQRLGFLFGAALGRGFSRASGPRASVHSTLRALWAQLAVGYVSAWRPSVISHCQDQQERDGCLLMSARDSYSCLFSPIHLLQASLPSLLRGVREFFVFSDQSNLQFHSPKLWNKRSAAFSNLNLVFSYQEGSLAFSDVFLSWLRSDPLWNYFPDSRSSIDEGSI